jgi:hypothetical protein
MSMTVIFASRGMHPAVRGELQRVAKLIGCDADDLAAYICGEAVSDHVREAIDLARQQQCEITFSPIW